MKFFTEDDINLLSENADKLWRDTSQGRQIEQDLTAGAWAKTREWGKLLATNGFVLDFRATVRKRAGKTPRQADGRQRMRQVYRPYTWARLYRAGDKARKIFFTVGIDGRHQALVWKLDCKREGTDKLPERQQARFDAYMMQHAPKALWQLKKLEDLESAQRTWEWLVKETSQFMRSNARHYDGALAHTWLESEPGRDKLARICWNTLGWQRPSGPVGKSTTASSHESSRHAGFGAEEWLFDFTRLLDGYHYGFLQPLNSGVDGGPHVGRELNIRLFTRNEATGDYYHAGRIYNAHVLSKEERQGASAAYERLGWYAEMQEELEEAGGTASVAPDGAETGPFNVRFLPTDVERPDTPDGLDLIADIGELTNSRRYKLFNDLGGYGSPTIVDDGRPARVVLKGRGPAQGNSRSRRIRGGQVELAGLHDKVQDNLVAYLKREFPKQQISKEACIEPYGTRIDVVRQRPDGGLTFYEVKVLPTAKACIREALGQLLEYAHWSASDLSREWVIVSYHALDASSGEYLKTIQDTYGLPVSYQNVELSN
jgi:hypothetical protein